MPIKFIFCFCLLLRSADGVESNDPSTDTDYSSIALQRDVQEVEKEELASIYGFNLNSNEASNCKEGLVEFEVRDHRSFIFAFVQTSLRVYGRNLKSSTALSFTTKKAERGDDCTDLRSTDVLPLIPVPHSLHTVATINVTLNLQASQQAQVFYVCVKQENDHNSPIFVHQGTGKWVQLVVVVRPLHSYMLPMWLQITMVVCLLILSGLFSGLNLGLMSLNVTELNILVNSGSPSEKKYAKTILPLRKKGNFLLCTILLSNVLVNNTLAILLDDLTMNGMLAIVGATIFIVIFGEIIPQSICSRYGLLVGARTILFTKIFMVVTFPLSYPISLLLDCVLGKELGYVFTRERLRELLRMTGDKTDLESEEVKIIAGALELSRKTIGTVMIRTEKVFMLEVDCLLDFETLARVSRTGFSRIPVYQQQRHKIVALLHVRDLTFVNPCDRTPLRTITAFHKHPLHFFPADTRLDVLLHNFKTGNPHMAFVEALDSPGEVAGVITLGNIIQEILGSKIIDEFDLIYGPNCNFTVERLMLDESGALQADQLSSQMALATLRFLSTSVAAFDSSLVSEEVLDELLCQREVLRSCCADSHLQEVGKPAKRFRMVLEGKVRVIFGKDEMVFEGGPFFHFGVQAILGSTASSEKATVERLMEEGEYSVADCTVKAVTKVQYVSISREVYLKAVRKTAHLRKMRKLSGDLLKNDHDKPAGSNGWLRSKLSRNSGGPVDIKVMSGQMDHLLPQSGDRTVEDEASQRSCESPTEGDKLTNHSANGSLTIELTSKRV